MEDNILGGIQTLGISGLGNAQFESALVKQMLATQTQTGNQVGQLVSNQANYALRALNGEKQVMYFAPGTPFANHNVLYISTDTNNQNPTPVYILKGLFDKACTTGCPGIGVSQDQYSVKYQQDSDCGTELMNSLRSYLCSGAWAISGGRITDLTPNLNGVGDFDFNFEVYGHNGLDKYPMGRVYPDNFTDRKDVSKDSLDFTFPGGAIPMDKLTSFLISQVKKGKRYKLQLNVQAA